MVEKKKKRSAKDETEFLGKAHKAFDRLYTEDEHNRVACRNNLNFVYEIGEGQWRQSVRDERKADGKPCLTSGKLRKNVAAIANTERDQRLAGNVLPVDSAGDVETARIIAALVRQIEHASDAERIYTEAGEKAIAGNVGYWRIKSEELDDSFDQELFLVEIKNQFSTYLANDGLTGFIGEKLTKDEFKYQYPKAREESFDSELANREQWYDDENIYIREYFYKERVKTTIVQARKSDASGQIQGEAKIFELDKDVSREELERQGWVIEKEKTPKRFKVKWAKITATQILSEGTWVGKDIPIVEVEGDWVWVEGKLYKRALIEGAKDDQRMYNFWISSLVERYALSIKAPYLVTVKMVSGAVRKWWKVASKKLLPFLAYNHDKNVPGGPKREHPPQISTAETSMLDIHTKNIDDNLGMYEAGRGQASNERTGVAIRERANRGQLSTYHFPDNFRRAINKSTRMLIDCIPHIYDTQRIQRIIGEDGKGELVTINEVLVDEASGEQIIHNDLSVGKYDIVEGVKLMSTRRQEQLQGMSNLVAGNPMLQVLLAGDIAKAQDWEGAQEIADKVEKYIRPLLKIPPEEGEGISEPESEGSSLL